MPDKIEIQAGGHEQGAELVLRLPDHRSTERLGEAIAEQIAERAVVALVGALGAGKTTLVKGIARGLGVTEVVNSPTFTMLNEYHSGRLPLYHLDLYRLQEDQADVSFLLEVELDELIGTETKIGKDSDMAAGVGTSASSAVSTSARSAADTGASAAADTSARSAADTNATAAGGSTSTVPATGKNGIVAVMEWAELFLTGGGKNYLDQLDHLVVKIEYGGNEVKPSEANGKKKSTVNDDEGRTAFFISHGPQSAALIQNIRGRLDDMFIYW